MCRDICMYFILGCVENKKRKKQINDKYPEQANIDKSILLLLFLSIGNC
jgi:hypothetical protein